MADSIGSFSFVSMSMVPLGSKQTTEIEVRSGVNGHYLWLTGTRGEPCQVETYVDVATIALAEDKMNDYEGIIGTVVAVIYASQTRPKNYFVMNVQPLPGFPRKTSLGVGGTLGTTSAAILGAIWTLVAVEA